MLYYAVCALMIVASIVVFVASIMLLRPVKHPVAPTPVKQETTPATPAPKRTLFVEPTAIFDPNLILVVDDDRDIVATIVAAIETELPGAKVLTASDGNEPVEIFKQSGPKPGVVVLDMILPKRSGFLVLEKIKKSLGGKKNVPPIVIMITGNQGRRHKMYAESLGIYDYLIKPFRMQSLVNIIKKAQAEFASVP